MKILLGLPTYSASVRVELLSFLADAARLCDLAIHPVVHRPVDVARNLIVSAAQRSKAEALVMVDADMAPAPQAFAALVKALGRYPVVGCPYQGHGGAVSVLALNEQPIPQREAISLSGVQPVGNLGTGLVAYRTEVFESVSPPYFYHEYNECHTAMYSTEDMVAHRRLRMAGVPLAVHWDYWAGHVSERIMDKPEVRSLEELRGLLAF